MKVVIKGSLIGHIMSFLSVLKTVGHGVGVGAKVAAGPAGLANPVLGLILSTVGSLETLIPQDNKGAGKKVIAESIVNEVVGPDKDAKAISDAIDHAVGLMNSIAVIHQGDGDKDTVGDIVKEVAPIVISKLPNISPTILPTKAVDNITELFNAIDQLVLAFKASYKK